MEQRLIDANALIDDLVWCKGQAAECNRDEWDGLIMRVLEQPTVDAVPVVRCKDCTFHNEINCPQYYRRNELPDDWFCADGKREEKENV